MQVMANLLSNAAKFSGDSSQVEIDLVRSGAIWRVSVTDHGAGIAEEFRDRIFQKFSQADSSDTRQIGGTGLGSQGSPIFDRGQDQAELAASSSSALDP